MQISISFCYPQNTWFLRQRLARSQYGHNAKHVLPSKALDWNLTYSCFDCVKSRPVGTPCCLLNFFPLCDSRAIVLPSFFCYSIVPLGKLSIWGFHSYGTFFDASPSYDTSPGSHIPPPGIWKPKSRSNTIPIFSYPVPQLSPRIFIVRKRRVIVCSMDICPLFFWHDWNRW